jgi:methylation protein EvaC
MRYAIAHTGSRKPSPSVTSQLEKESKLGLDKLETYNQFRRNVERSRDALADLLQDLKQKGQRVVGYGATSKSTTVTNYCGITSDLVEFISDTTPIKQGRFSPGVHIPVRPYEEFKSNYPPYALLFAWNHGEEIMEKEQDFQRAGGKWITYVPKVTVS